MIPGRTRSEKEREWAEALALLLLLRFIVLKRETITVSSYEMLRMLLQLIKRLGWIKGGAEELLVLFGQQAGRRLTSEEIGRLMNAWMNVKEDGNQHG